MKALILISLLSMALGASVFAQPDNIRMSKAESDPEEVTIAINPANPDNIIGGANLKYFYYSFDGGKTWDESEFPSGTWGDPCVMFDEGGRAYCANLTYGWDAITVRTSDDGGKTWSKGTKLYGPSSDSAKVGSLFKSSLQDKEWLVADITNSPYKGTIYASWTDFTKYGSHDPIDSSVIVFARSTNRGDSFEPFVRVSDIAGDAVDSDNTMEGAVPAVGPQGDVYLAWSGPDGLYFDQSRDGGTTWGKDRVLTPLPGGWDFDISGISRCNGLPITLCDISNSPQKGTVYINWIDWRHGDPDVFILRSSDRGTTWSQPIRVNDDAIGNGKEQFFTWATVDPVTGELIVVYYDRRNYNTDSTDVYLARSTDGGLTFTNERISEAAFLPSAMVFFGDYIGVSAYNGRIRPIWTRLQDGMLSVHTALIEQNTTNVHDETTPSENLLQQPYPNPLTEETNYRMLVQFQTSHGGHVRLTIHDLVGRKVVDVMEEHIDAGTHSYPVHLPMLPSGTYFVRMISGAAGAAEQVQHRYFSIIK